MKKENVDLSILKEDLHIFKNSAEFMLINDKIAITHIEPDRLEYAIKLKEAMKYVVEYEPDFMDCNDFALETIALIEAYEKRKEATDKVDAKDLKDLLSARICKILLKAKITKFGDIRWLSSKYLLNLPKFGQVSLLEVNKLKRRLK